MGAAGAAFAVLTGLVYGIVRRQHRSAKFIELLRLLAGLVPNSQVIRLIRDPVSLHRSAEVAVYVANRPWRFRLHRIPARHGHQMWLAPNRMDL